MLAIAWSASTPEGIAECLQSLSRATVFARHNPSLVGGLIRRNVIEALGALSTRTLGHGVDFVDAVVVILEQQLFKPPSRLDGLIIEHLVGVAIVGPDSIFQAFGKQLVQITSQLLEYIAADCTKKFSGSQFTPLQPQRHLSMQQGGTDPLNTNSFNSAGTLSTLNVDGLTVALPKSVAKLVDDTGTARPIDLLAELFDQFLFMFIMFGIRTFERDLAAPHAQLWATPLRTLAPGILGPVARAIKNRLPAIGGAGVAEGSSGQEPTPGSDLLPCFWGLAAILGSEEDQYQEDHGAPGADAGSSGTPAGWGDLVAYSESMKSRAPSTCLARFPQLVGGSAVLNKMASMAHNTLLAAFVDCDSQVQSRVKYLDTAAAVHYCGLLALERRRVRAENGEFQGTMAYLAQMHARTPAADQMLVQAIADTVFRTYMDSEGERVGDARQEQRLESLAEQLIEYSSDSRSLIKQCAGRYLAEIMGQYTFLFWSQRVVVYLLDHLQFLSAHHAVGWSVAAVATMPNYNGAVLPYGGDEFGGVVQAFAVKSREHLAEALALARAKTLSVLQSYVTSVAFDFTTETHAGVELAMQCLQKRGPGADKNGSDLGSFGANVAQQSRFLAEVTALAESHAEQIATGPTPTASSYQVLGREFVAAINTLTPVFSQVTLRRTVGGDRDGAVGKSCTTLVRLAALSVLEEACHSLWIRAIFWAPVVAGNDRFLKTALFAWRWLLSKRPEFTTRALSEISQGLAVLYIRFQGGVPRQKALHLSGDLYRFVGSLFATSNKLRRDHTHLFRKLTLDTINVLHKHGADIAVHARYAAMALSLEVLQSSDVPDESGKRITRTRLYDSILRSFSAVKPCPHVRTLAQDIGGMVSLWKLMVLDKPFCKQLDATCSGEAEQLTWKRNLSLVLVHHDLMRYFAWHNPRELHDLHSPHEDEVRRMARPNPNPSDNTCIEYIRLTWALNPSLSVHVVSHMFGPQPIAKTSAVSKSLGQLVRTHPDEVAHVPAALDFGLEGHTADVKMLMSWSKIPPLKGLLLLHTHGNNLATLRYAASIVENEDEATHTRLLPQLVQVLRWDHATKIWEALLCRLAARSQFFATHLIWNLNCQKGWHESVDIARHIADSLPRSVQKELRRDLEAVEKLLLLSYRIETDRVMKNSVNPVMLEELRLAADKLQGCGTLLGNGERILSIAPCLGQSFNGTFNLRVSTQAGAVEPRQCRFKHSVDLRRDMLINQMVDAIKTSFKKAGLDLPVMTRRVIAMKQTGGLVDVGTSEKQLRPIGGKHTSIFAYLQDQTRAAGSRSLEQSLQRCIQSMAGIAVVLYLLQCSPPALATLSIHSDGRLCVEDFGKLNKISDSEIDFKKAMSVYDLLGDESGLGFWGMYIDLCIRGFLAARYHQDQFVGLATILIPQDGDRDKHFANRIAQGIHARLLPGKSDSEASLLPMLAPSLGRARASHLSFCWNFVWVRSNITRALCCAIRLT